MAAGLGLAGSILAFVATFSTVIEIKSITVTLDALSGWDRHGPALILLGVFALLMLAGAARGARPAMGALAGAGIGVLLIALLIDQPHLHDAGRFEETFEATAKAGKGWLFETASGVLLLLSGVLMLMLAPRGEPAPRPRPDAGERAREAPAAPAPAAEPTTQPRTEDWFAESPVESRAQRLTQPPAPQRRGGLLDKLRRGR